MLLEYLQVYCDIVESGSFSKAAARHYISQSAVSQQVKALEQQMGQRLLERSPHGLSPTDAGLRFYQGCREIVDRWASLERELQDLGHAVAGTVRVQTVYSVGLHDLPPVIKRFMQLYPQASIHVEYSRTNRINQAVQQNLCDLGIVAYPEETRDLTYISLPSDELVVIVPPGHPLAGQPSPLAPGALQGMPFVAFDPDIPTRGAVDRLLAGRGVRVRVVSEFDNVETIKRSVEAEVGVSIVPRRTCAQELRSGSLTALALAGDEWQRPVGAIYRRKKQFGATLKAFVALLTEQSSALGSATEAQTDRGATPGS